MLSGRWSPALRIPVPSSHLKEMLAAKTTKREGRLLDRDQTGSMEKKKREGYF